MKVSRARVDEQRVADPAVRPERELRYAAAVDVVVLIEGAVRVPSLQHCLDDVVPHRQDAAVAAAVADKSLAAGARHHDRIVEDLRIRDRPMPVRAASCHQERRIG